MIMTRSPDNRITLWVPENSTTSMVIEPNDAGGPPVLMFEREDGNIDVFNWETMAYQPVDWVALP